MNIDSLNARHTAFSIISMNVLNRIEEMSAVINKNLSEHGNSKITDEVTRQFFLMAKDEFELLNFTLALIVNDKEFAGANDIEVKEKVNSLKRTFDKCSLIIEEKLEEFKEPNYTTSLAKSSKRSRQGKSVVKELLDTLGIK